jgi:hypothetical protein
MALVSMKRKPDNEPYDLAMEGEYGYGTCIHLDEDQCNALGLTTLPAPGQAVMIRARAVVTRTMIENDGDGPEHHMSLQITDMEMGGAQSEQSTASLLYGE